MDAAAGGPDRDLAVAPGEDGLEGRGHRGAELGGGEGRLGEVAHAAALRVEHADHRRRGPGVAQPAEGEERLLGGEGLAELVVHPGQQRLHRRRVAHLAEGVDGGDLGEGVAGAGQLGEGRHRLAGPERAEGRGDGHVGVVDVPLHLRGDVEGGDERLHRGRVADLAEDHRRLGPHPRRLLQELAERLHRRRLVARRGAGGRQRGELLVEPVAGDGPLRPAGHVLGLGCRRPGARRRRGGAGGGWRSWSAPRSGSGWTREPAGPSTSGLYLPRTGLATGHGGAMGRCFHDLCSTGGRLPRISPAMRLVFLGTPEFAVPTVEALRQAGHEILAVVAQPDRPAGRGQALKAPATKTWALAHGVPVLQPREGPRRHARGGPRGRCRPDALVVTAYGRILGKDLLTLAPYGAVNVHASLLPRWRGAAPIQWAVASGDAETGVTIMQMDEGLDTGDALLTRTLAIGAEETAAALAPRLAALGGEAMVEALPLLAAGALVPVRQDGARHTLAPILEKGHGRLDFARPAAALAALVRGMTPWPGAFTTLDGKGLKVHVARPAPGEGHPGQPGDARAAGGALRVTCGGGTALDLLELQPEGRRRMPAADFLNGLGLRPLVLGR